MEYCQAKYAWRWELRYDGRCSVGDRTSRAAQSVISDGGKLDDGRTPKLTFDGSTITRIYFYIMTARRYFTYIQDVSALFLRTHVALASPGLA